MRPREASNVYGFGGGAGRSLAFIALTAAIAVGPLLKLDSLHRFADLERGTALPAPIQLLFDLTGWAHSWFLGWIPLLLIGIALDRLLLFGTINTRSLLRAWAFSLSPLWTLWLLVALAYAGGALFLTFDPEVATRASPGLALVGILLVAPLILWWIALPAWWITWRVFLLGRATTTSRWRARVAALLTPSVLVGLAYLS